MIWTFGNFELDERNCVLLRDGEPLQIRRRVFAVLHYLVAHSGALITKEELLANVWPNESTVEAVLPQNIAILRQLLGDDHKNGKFIQTVHGRGYRFIAPVARAGMPPSAAAASTCIGRDHVMSELTGLVDVTCSGTGQSIVLQGDPGIGKTTLLHELSEQASTRGVWVLDAHCQDAAGAPSFWPWQQILRPLIARTGREPGPELSRLLGAVSAAEEGAERDARASSEARFRMFDSITALIAEASSAQPIMLAFDDLHWADHASIQLLSFVARELRRWPVMLLGTVRTLQVTVDDVAQATLATWLASSHVRLINLLGLSQAATAQLARQVLGQELKQDWLSGVHEITEGNPFHVQQWARLLLEDVASGRSASAPLRLREVIALRIKRLGARVEHVLTRAAIIGRAFNVAVLAQLADGTRSELLAALSSALDARIIQRVGKVSTRVGWYEFSHALMQEVLYDRVPHADRTRMHWEIGCALEAISGLDAEPSVHLLAQHFYQAAVSGNPARAVHYCRLAAEQSFRQLAFEHAVAWFRSALSALALQLPVDELQRYELKCRLGSALFRAGEDGTPAFQDAAAVARAQGRGDLLAQVVVAMQGWPQHRRRGRTDNPAFYPLLQEALQHAHELPPGRRSQLLCLLALNAPEHCTSFAQQIELSRDALVLAREDSDPGVLYDAIDARLRLMGRPDELRLRLALARELKQIALQLGDRERSFHAHMALIQPLIALGQLDEAERELAGCVQLAEALDLPRFTLQVLRLKLQRALSAGQFDEVRDLTKRAVAVRGPAPPSPHYLVSLYAWQTSTRVARGDRAWAERHALALLPKIEQSRLLRAHMAALHAACESLDAARSCYAPLLAPEVLSVVDEDWLLMLIWIADAVIACEDRAAARIVYEALLPHAELNVTHVEWLMCVGACDYWLGALGSLLGEWQQAATHLVRAVELNGRLGAQPALAWSCYACARALLQLDAESGAAHAMRARAQAIAEELQLSPLLRAVQTLQVQHAHESRAARVRRAGDRKPL